MFRKSVLAAVACTAIVGTSWAQNITAKINVVEPHPAAASRSASSSPCTVTLSDDCGYQGNLFGRARAQLQTMTRRSSDNGFESVCCGDCQAASDKCASRWCFSDSCGPRIGKDYFGRDQGCCEDSCEVSCSDPCRYRSVFGGWVGLEDLDTVDAGNQQVTGTFEDGWVVGMATGRYLDNCMRVEMEGAYRNNSGDQFTVGTAPTVAFNGSINNWATMFNAYRDFKNCGKLTPYVGGGIGFAYLDGNFNAGGNAFSIDDWTFAYQAIAGFSVQTEKNRDFFVEYRFYGNTEVDMVPTAGPALDFEYLSHNIIFGIRFNR